MTQFFYDTSDKVPCSLTGSYFWRIFLLTFFKEKKVHNYCFMTGASPSQNFIFTGAGAPLPPGVKGKAAAKAGQVTFETGAKDSKERKGGDADTVGGVRCV